MEEIWKDIDGYDGKYRISSFGSIFSNHRNKVLKATKNKRTGYLHVTLYKNTKAIDCNIHRLVASAFISNPNNYKEVNHKFGDKEDNRACMLEWVSHSYNEKHAFMSGLKKRAVIVPSQVKEIRLRHANGEGYKKISKSLNVSRGCIRDIINGRTWRDV